MADLLAQARDGDFLRSVAEAVLQILMEADVEGLIGAGRHERTGERLNYRNGFRDRTLETRLCALHPIENPFAKLKAMLRKAAARTVEGLWNTIGRIVGTFTPAECANYFAAAGYDPD